MTSVAGLTTPVHPGISTSDPLRSLVDVTSAIRTGAANGVADVAAIEANLGLTPDKPPVTVPENHGVILIVVGLLVLVGVVGVVIYVVKRGGK